MTTVYIYSKSLSNTCRLLTHFYFTIPKLDLEIHPGQFFSGTHHKLGTFKKHSVIVGEKVMCETCVDELLRDSRNLTDAWYYPVINCESLTRGLLYKNPISIQTILLTIVITFFLIGIAMPIYFIASLFFTILLILFNNIHVSYSVATCGHPIP